MDVTSNLENGIKTITIVGEDCQMMRNIERMILDAAVLDPNKENAVPEYESTPQNNVRAKAGRKIEPVFTNNPSDEYLQEKIAEMRKYHDAFYREDLGHYVVEGKHWSKMKFAVALCRKFLSTQDNLKGFVRLIDEEFGITVDYSNFYRALKKANRKKNRMQ